MKSVKDLNELIPILVDMVLDHPKIGSRYFGRCEEDYDEEWESNYVIYEEDGWYIEINYRCCGDWDEDSGDYYTPPSCDLIRAWGEVESIEASYGEDDDYQEFDDEELDELWKAIDSALENF